MSCIEGPASDMLQGSIDDVMCMRLAQHLTSSDLHPLRAWLLDREGDQDFLQKTQENYSVFRQAEFAFVIMHEWRNRSVQPSVNKLHQLMVNANIDKHVFCRVCSLLIHPVKFDQVRPSTSDITLFHKL